MALVTWVDTPTQNLVQRGNRKPVDEATKVVAIGTIEGEEVEVFNVRAAVAGLR